MSIWNWQYEYTINSTNPLWFTFCLINATNQLFLSMSLWIHYNLLWFTKNQLYIWLICININKIHKIKNCDHLIKERSVKVNCWCCSICYKIVTWLVYSLKLLWTHGEFAMKKNLISTLSSQKKTFDFVIHFINFSFHLLSIWQIQYKFFINMRI